MLEPMKKPDPSSPDPTGPLSERGQAIFDGALQLPSNQRASYVEQACADDTRLCGQVKGLLGAHEKADGFLDPRTVPLETVVVPIPVTEKPGDKIGRYKLLQQLGEGGCGIVYMAEQEEPVRRRVALKVIKLGMDTKSVIARFEAERQALALMDHPNIAKVLDAGATETGRPYFVMELVRGIKITEYCDQNKLSTSERLKLFIQVCHAIQHAHQKGIIHRDIKPSNILVTLHDGLPVPKVIDFGIAKATQGRLTDQTLFTAFEQFIGTPAYMSPEQAEMSGLDIDTRCDIYGLGVLVYELLTGQTPFDAKELLASGLDKMRHTIREQEPERPSTRLSTMLNAELTNTASHRRTEPPKLIHLLRGDLDWIVMKALEKDRTRRYETANALGMDIQRHLDNEPVLATPPSSMYRFQKLVRRNKVIFAAAAAVALALITGLGTSLYLLARERTARERAVAAEATQAEMRREAEEGARIGQALGRAGLLLSREQYDQAEKLASEIPPEPASAAIFNVLGMVHARHGRLADAIRNFGRSTEVAPDDHDAYHCLAPLLAQSGDQQAYHRLCARIVQQFAGSSDPAIAERMAKDCLILPSPGTNFESITRMVNTALAAGNKHPFWNYFQFVKGLAEYRQGHFENSAEWLQKVLADQRDPHRTMAAYMVLAMAEHQLKQPDAARATLAKGAKLADAHVASIHGPQWNDQMAARVLMAEAKALIESEAK
jgi:eukaryotic-like serine/threonine-protein kinase